MTKAQPKKELERLVTKARLCELDELLHALGLSFRDWKNEKICSFELSDRIFEFCKGKSRELNLIYSKMKAPELLARAVSMGLIDRSEVSPDLLSSVESSIAAFDDLARM